MNNPIFSHSSAPSGGRRFARLAAVLAFITVAALFLASCSRQSGPTKPADVDYYTCTMHPSVRSQKPNDKCPICGMSLVPVMKKGQTNSASMPSEPAIAAATAPTVFTVPVARQQEIGVTYATVERTPLRQTVRTIGTVTYDKQRHWDFVARVDGYVQKLQISSRGDSVAKGQPLMSIYSPDLLTTQREFLDLLRMRDNARKSGSAAVLESAENLMESAKRRLLQWNVTPEQIAELEQTRVAKDTLTLYSPFQGVVQDLAVDQGRRVAMGDHLVDLADLSTVWVWAEFYQDELALLKKGLPVTVTTSAQPGEKFTGKIDLVDPWINEATRTARVRLEVENAALKLRPEMYVNVELASDSGEGLSVPVNAVMPTGERNLVFVDKGGGKLEPRFVELGKKFGANYAVNSGLQAGERVVSSANFLIDAEAKVQGALQSW